jgi:tricorn protease
MPASGGEPKRLTFFGGTTRPVGWSRDGSQIFFATNHGAPFLSMMSLRSIAPEGGPTSLLPVGPAQTISFGPDGGAVIGRHASDLARWKRYHGGTAGDLWVDPDGSGDFHRLITLHGNVAAPMWIGERIYFVADHEGYGNIYSCTPGGKDLRRHTDHQEYYARNPATDGRRIVYHAGGELYLLDPDGGDPARVPVEYSSPRTQRSRKFVNGADYLQSYAPHPEGHSLALVMRGRPVSMGAFAGPVLQHGSEGPLRYRHARYLNDGSRLVATCDDGDAHTMVILAPDGSEDRLEGLDIGRADDLQVSPTADRVALANHRNEIIVVDLAARRMEVIDRSRTLHDQRIAWSPDGRWLAFNHAEVPETSCLMVADLESGQIHQITDPVLHDVAPAFDPEGRYLYFISYREFDPVADNLHFDLGFPRGTRPYLIPLRRDVANPFLVVPKAPKQREKETTPQQKHEVPTVEIDLADITRRLIPFPVKEGRYTQIAGVAGQIYLLSRPADGLLDETWLQPKSNGVLESFDFELQKTEPVASGVDDFKISADLRTLVYRSGKRLRALTVGSKPDAEAGDAPGVQSGWIDLSRPKVPVIPGQEWRQMYREAWSLQRDFFWTEGMLGIDWDGIYSRYLRLIDRIGSRSEFSDVILELHGELGTSHAFEMGGDYRQSPSYAQGFLGADFRYDEEAQVWRIAGIVRGDSWSERYGSPLERAGVNLTEEDRIIAINGRRLTHRHGPMELLVNTAGAEIALAVAPAHGGTERTVTVKALRSETPVRYRAWVEENRRMVHQATDGRVGYVHIPDMGVNGYSEFHRGFLSEVGRGALIVDVRFNSGGFVSQLILEKLARKPLGYRIPRHGLPSSYPDHATAGPLVALTNEYAGSDGDIFSHGFKLMKLGPLLGKRTWGGVVGISPRNPLVDGSYTTQPEFSTWFEDVKWGLENYGTDPDIEIDMAPQDYVRGRDVQLERATAEILRLLDLRPVMVPAFDERPMLAPGPLPARAMEA